MTIHLNPANSMMSTFGGDSHSPIATDQGLRFVTWGLFGATLWDDDQRDWYDDPLNHADTVTAAQCDATRLWAGGHDITYVNGRPYIKETGAKNSPKEWPL